MTNTIFIASSEGGTGKSTVALGFLDALLQTKDNVGVFRPITKSHQQTDRVVELLIGQRGVEQDYADAIGVSYDEMNRDPERAQSDVLQRFAELKERFNAILVLGSDYTGLANPHELAFNAGVAANLGAPLVLVVRGDGRTPQEIDTLVSVARAEVVARHADLTAVVANRVDPNQLNAVLERLQKGAPNGLPVAAIPDHPVLMAPTVADLQEACGGTLLRGNSDWMQRESMGFVVAAMGLPHVLDRLIEGSTVIAPSDRYDLMPGLFLAHQAGTFPGLTAVVLTGGYELPEQVERLLEGLQQDLPVISSPHGTFETATMLSSVRGRLSVDSDVKIETARRLFAEHVDATLFSEAFDLASGGVVTPLMFEFDLLARARGERKRIVLPEGEDDRVLEAAAILTRRGVADLTILGEEHEIRARAKSLGLDLGETRVLSPTDPELVERFAAEYQRLRSHKGMTLEKAREVVTDGSYFGTLMVHLDLADGMVSGAAHTTAHTIKPSFEIVKTKPGVGIVSSVFLMALEDRVLVYGDCAVNPDPTAEQLADIAVSSAETAAEFGIEPRVAMLSYSTGASGSGAGVDKVRAATKLVRERHPELALEGPIQYDAAVDASVAKTKLPDSAVAGRATVFVFPDLNTGNNTYKAVQRSAGAVAIGPVLQGLNRPVNDLSRGALVDDIVNTVIITAIQAQSADRNPATATEGVSA